MAFLIVRQLRNLVLPDLLLRRLGATSSAFGFFLRQALRTAARLGTIGTSRSFPLFGTPRRPSRSWRRTRIVPASRSTASQARATASPGRSPARALRAYTMLTERG